MTKNTKLDDAGLKKYLRQVHALDGEGVKVGIQAETGAYIDSRTNILDVAMYNELGTETIPARPFIRTFAQTNAKALGAVMDRAVDLVTRGKPLGVALDEMGGLVQEQQQKHIRASKSWAEPNAKSTVKQKGSDVPLIDHATLVNAIRWSRI